MRLLTDARTLARPGVRLADLRREVRVPRREMRVPRRVAALMCRGNLGAYGRCVEGALRDTATTSHTAVGERELSMKRIGLMGAVGALAMALLVPASVSAHSPHSSPAFEVRVDKASCSNRGGKYGFGKVVLRMSAYARNDLADEPTPNYIFITTWLQEKIDGVWVNLGVGHTTPEIYPDGYPGVFEENLGASWQFKEADHPRTRLLMKVEFFDDLPTGDVRLGKVSARTAAC